MQESVGLTAMLALQKTVTENLTACLPRAGREYKPYLKVALQAASTAVFAPGAAARPAAFRIYKPMCRLLSTDRV
jgi:hypothetical protein